MLENLYLYNFSVENSPDSFELAQVHSLAPFTMQTCQRTLVLSLGAISFKALPHKPEIQLRGESAYAYVLEMLCGLKSRLVAEHEIVAQFKQAFDGYLLSIHRDSQMILCLQKLLQDTKKIRTQHLLGISQKTYAALSRRILRKRKLNDSPILIYGTGQLAEDLVNQFKKTNPVFVTGRTESKVEKLIKSHGVSSIQWQSYDKYHNYQFQLNTIGTEEVLFNQSFFNSLDVQSLFIDLASPSPVCKDAILDKNRYYGLDNIYKAGAIENGEKKKKILNAKTAIIEISANRMHWFQKHKERKRERLDEKIHNWNKRKHARQSTGPVY